MTNSLASLELTPRIRRTTLRISAVTALAALFAACSPDATAPESLKLGDPKVEKAGQELLDSIGAGLHSKLAERTDDSVRNVVADRGETVTTTDARTQQISTQKFRVQRVKYSLAKNADKFMTVDANSGIVWPGAVIQGKSVAGNAPSPVPVPDSVRKPLRVTMNILSGAGAANGISRIVPTPSDGSVGDSISKLLAGFAGAAPAKVSLDIRRVNSSSQLNASLGLGYSGTGFDVAGKFGYDWSEKKTRFIVSLIQQYYTMSIQPPDGPSGLWDITRWGMKDLRIFASEANPVTYISSVTYGRVFYMVYETSEDATQLSAALNAAYNGGLASATVEAKAKYQKALASASMKMYQYGGSAEDGFNATDLSNPTGIQDFLKKGASFSNASPGAPLSFVARYLYNNDLVKLANMMEYEVEEKIPEGDPVISWVQSDFNLQAISAEAWGPVNWDKGGVKLRVLVFDDDKGTKTEMWKSPCNVFCGQNGEGFKIPSVPWAMGDKRYPVTWPPTASIKLDNRPKLRLGVECTVWNYENNTWGNDIHIYEWDDLQGRYTLRGNKDARFCWGTTPDRRISGGFHIEVRVNGQLQ